MAWFFGDGFDLYQQFTDSYMSASYWDSGATGYYDLSSAGRFTGSRGLISSSSSSNSIGALVKSSGSNDAVHHINISVCYNSAPSGTTLKAWLTLYDGTTAQCTVCFRSDGTILLISGAVNSGTTLATYSGAIPSASVWYSFEFEIIINNTTGSFKVRKNGNTSDDSSTTGLNTRGGTGNNYANKLALGYASNALLTQQFDDLLWRSDTSSVSWAGDVRCYTRLPAADAAVQFTRSGSTVPVTPFAQGSTTSIATGSTRYCPFTASCAGTLGTASVSLATGYTGNMKCTLFADNSGAPGTIIASATTISNPVAGNNTFTFSSPPSVVQGTKYWLGFASDVTSGSWNIPSSVFAGAYNNSGAVGTTISYASFPSASPSVTAQVPAIFTANITPTTVANANLVADPTQDGAGGYVYDSTATDQDLYTLQAISGTPSNILAVVTRALAQKSDAGTRNIGVQLKSGATTSNGTSTALNTSFGWVYRTDTVDPNTSAVWDATGVNNLNVGVKVTA